MKTMISVQEAKELIRLSVKTIGTQDCSLAEANGLVLAEDIFRIKISQHIPNQYGWICFCF